MLDMCSPGGGRLRPSSCLVSSASRPPSGTRRPPSSDSQQRLLRPTSCFVLPGAVGRNAPARVRALRDSRPASSASGGTRSRPLSAVPGLPCGEAGAQLRPRSAGLPASCASLEEELSRIALLGADPATPAMPAPSPEMDATHPCAAPADVPNSAASRTAIGRPIHVPYRPDIRAKVTIGMTVHTHCKPTPMTFRDYSLLAEACQRAGKARMEGHAYYKIAELLAQKRESLERAIPYFQKYLNICRRLNDLQEIGTDAALQRSLEYHQQHCDIADAAGVFIANTNMGLITGMRADLKRSVEHHKQALQFAVRAQDKQAEALALANLALSERHQGDHATARVCIERNLELSHDLKDEPGSCDAYEQLGVLSSDKKDWATASDFLTQALDLSHKQGNFEKTSSIRCRLGFVKGTMRMDDHFKAVAKLMGAKADRRQRKSNALR